MAPSSPTIHRPTPRRPFDLNLTAATPPDTSTAPSPINEGLQPTTPNRKSSTSSNFLSTGAETPSFSRTRSILNLTSSTLFGIYSSTTDGGAASSSADYSLSTPWGTGAQTPIRERAGSLENASPTLGNGNSHYGDGSMTRPTLHKRHLSHMAHISPRENALNLFVRILLLFILGTGYGVLVTHLHNEQRVAAVEVKGVMRPRYDWRYLAFWGVCGVGLGSALPWVDALWGQGEEEELVKGGSMRREEVEGQGSGNGGDWTPAVRSVGAFVGIAFAIRKLPWSSPLQVSLTLFLVNPVLWYLIDRSKPGLLLSLFVGTVGTLSLLLLNPEMLPTPIITPYSSRSSLDSAHADFGFKNATAANATLMGGLVAQETLEVGTWIISVLFCSCVCFGNVGRRLALRGGGTR